MARATAYQEKIYYGLQQKNTQTSREIQKHVMFISIDPHVKQFSDGNQTVSNAKKKKNHGLPLCQKKVNGVCIVDLLLPNVFAKH
jgi:hypothetical protein